MSIIVNRWWVFIVILIILPVDTGEVSTGSGLSLGRSREPLIPEMVREPFSRSCQSCHGLHGHGIIGVAPDLRRIATRTRDEWVDYLRHDGKDHPVTAPPPLWLTGGEIELMAGFLMTFPARIEIEESLSR